MKYLKYFKKDADYQQFINGEGDEMFLPNVSVCEENNNLIYKPIIKLNIDNYLTIEALEDGLTAKLSLNDCEYCVDGDGDWKTLYANTETEPISANQTLSFKGNLIPTTSGNGSQGTSGIGKFTVNGNFNLKGNCMSMLFGDDAVNGKPKAFWYLFYNNKGLKHVAKNFLPATTLSSHCYGAMFYNCTNLITPPDLPATTLEDNCYESMFLYCNSLTTTPVLPAPILTYRCYSNLFYGCTSINRVDLYAVDYGPSPQDKNVWDFLKGTNSGDLYLHKDANYDSSVAGHFRNWRIHQ